MLICSLENKLLKFRVEISVGDIKLGGAMDITVLVIIAAECSPYRVVVNRRNRQFKVMSDSNTVSHGIVGNTLTCLVFN